MGIALVLLGMLGCQDGPDPALAEQWHRDRVAYVHAAEAPTEPERCQPIQEPGLRHECIALSAAALARTGRVAEATILCEELQRGPWHHECVFAIIDLSDLRGEDARQACKGTGPHHDRCLGHALRREAADLIARTPPGQEPALLESLEQLAAEYFPSSARDRAERFLIQLLAARDPDVPFGRQHCGGMDADFCARVYTERLMHTTRAEERSMDLGDTLPWEPGCDGGPVPIARAEGLGLPTWEPEMDPIVQKAWKELCRR